MPSTPGPLETPVSNARITVTPQSRHSIGSNLDSSFTITSSPSASFTSKRRIHKRTPIKNEPLAKLSSPSITVTVGKTPEEINACYEQWMKLAADDKINAPNSWNIGLIDCFASMEVLKVGGSINFQKASCTLDGCVKIYTTRVDSVASETEKLVSGLNDAKAVEESPEEGEGEREESTEKTTKKSKRSQTRTLEKDFSSITTNKYDLEFMVDPLFRKTSADFDEGGAKGLLFHHLQVYGQGQLIFDSSDATLTIDTTLDSMDVDQVEEEWIDLNDYQDVFQVRTETDPPLSICPSLDKFVFTEDAQSYEEALQSMQLQLFDDMNPEDDIQIEPISTSSSSSSSSSSSLFPFLNENDEDDGEHRNFYVDFHVPGITDYDDAQEEVLENDVLQEEVPSTTSLTHPLHSPTEVKASLVSPESGEMFEFLPLPKPKFGMSKLSNTFSSSSSLSSSSSKESKSTRAPRKPKEPFTIDFLHTKPIHVSMIFEPGGSSVNLPKTTDRLAHRYQLPPEDPFDETSLSRFFTKPLFQITRTAADSAGLPLLFRPVSSTDPMFMNDGLISSMDSSLEKSMEKGEDMDETVIEKEMAADWAFEAPVHDEDDEDYSFHPPPPPPLSTMSKADITTFNHTSELDLSAAFDYSSQLSTQMSIASTTSAPTKLMNRFSSRLRPNFSKRSKQVDVKKLKENIWKYIRINTHEDVPFKSNVLPSSPTTSLNSSVTTSPLSNSNLISSSSSSTSSSSSSSSSMEKDAMKEQVKSHPIDFQQVIQNISSNYNESQIKDISVPFCFICLLHLANEKNLTLESNGEDSLLVYT